MRHNCPLCGTPLETPSGYKWDRNVLVTSRGSVTFGAVQQTIVKAIMRGPVSREALAEIAGIYKPETSVSLQKVREKLRSVGLNIINVGGTSESLYIIGKWPAGGA